MKLSKLSLLSLATLFTIGAQASECVNYQLSESVAEKVSSKFLTNGSSLSFGLSKYDDGSEDTSSYVDGNDTIIYSQDMASTVGYSSENGSCDLNYVHFEHDLTRFKKKESDCGSVISNALATIAENHSLLKSAQKAGTLQFNKVSSESGPVMTNAAGKKIGIYDYLDASYSATVGDKKVSVTVETFTSSRKIKKGDKTRISRTCFLSSVNVTQE